MKSIHFNQVPDMKGKKTMPFTDVVAFNAKEKLNEMLELKLAAEEIRDGDFDYEPMDYDDLTPDWHPSWEASY